MAIFNAAVAFLTGVISYFENSWCVRRSDTIARTLSKRNHFGSFRSTINGGCISWSNMYSPSSTINFTVCSCLFSNFGVFQNVLLLDVGGFFSNRYLDDVFCVFWTCLKEGAKAGIRREKVFNRLWLHHPSINIFRRQSERCGTVQREPPWLPRVRGREGFHEEDHERPPGGCADCPAEDRCRGTKVIPKDFN